MLTAVPACESAGPGAVVAGVACCACVAGPQPSVRFESAAVDRLRWQRKHCAAVRRREVCHVKFSSRVSDVSDASARQRRALCPG